VKSLLPSGKSSDPSLNLTLRESEIRAYKLSIQYAQRGNKTTDFGPCLSCLFERGAFFLNRDRRVGPHHGHWQGSGMCDRWTEGRIRTYIDSFAPGIAHRPLLVSTQR
jgi:hypothetical protein